MVNRQALNIVANFSGVGARLVFTLVFNVIYFRLLGSESFGLFGFFTSLAALSSLFDLGLNQTTVREVARREADEARAGELRSVVFTLQFLLGGIGLSLGLLVALGSQWIAASWFSVTNLTIHEVAVSVAMMGFALALMFPVNFFYGTLIGLQRQVLSNAIIVAATAFRGALTLVALFGFGSSPTIFFFAQTVASAIELTVLACLVWRLLPSSRQPPRFDTGVLKATWKFSSGAWLAVTFAQVATLCDKILLSTLLPLHWFGVYSLAVTVTIDHSAVGASLHQQLFPSFRQAAGAGSPGYSGQRIPAGFRIRVSGVSGCRPDAGGLCRPDCATIVPRSRRNRRPGVGAGAARGGEHAERGDGVAVFAAVRPRHHGRGATDQFCPVRAVSGGAGYIGAALRGQCRRRALAGRQCRRVPGADRHDPSGGSAWTGRTMAGSHGPATGLCRGPRAGGGCRCHARPVAAADAGLDRSQWRAGACGRVAGAPRRRAGSSVRALAPGAGP